MNRILTAGLATALGLAATSASADKREFSISLKPLASVSTQSVGATGAEIVAYDRRTRRAFAINSQDNDVVVIDLRNPASPSIVTKLSMNAYGGGLNSVDAKDGLVAVAVEAVTKTDPGRVVFVDAKSLAVRGSVVVGAQPDMLTFTHDGERVLVANEGEANSYSAPTSVNPEGSVSIIDLSNGVSNAVVNTADFKSFNASKAALVAAGVRIYSPGATVAQDLEPEYITQRGRTAWVTLQEANAVAVVDIPTATVQTIVPLGTKDHMLPGNGLDPSDRDGAANAAKIAIGNWPVYGMYQPDAIASFRVRGQTYLVTANEGDSRSASDFPGFEEEVRVGSSAYRLDPTAFPNAAALKTNAALARLTVTNQTGDTDGDGDFDRIDVFGARSISIWNASGQLVWDSGDRIEQFFANPANGWSDLFNANNTLTSNNAIDDRSDNKGPEPEGVTVGRIGDRQFAFVTLERVGGVMAFDVTNPQAPSLQAYANTRTRGATAGGDLGPEGIEFIDADDSPNGQPLLLVGNEVSRTVSVIAVERVKTKSTRDDESESESED
jgi:hypothetical protein